jgi:YVTN family beta-propeller protein
MTLPFTCMAPDRLRAHVTPRERARALGALGLVMLSCCTPGCHAAPSGPRVYVSNEVDGTVSVIDPRSEEVVATIAVGKRPRAMRLSPDGKRLYVALSGSPRGGPGVDDASLPPPDRTADGIGVIDLEAQKLERVIESGPDPEVFDLLGASTLVVSNEDQAQVSIIDLARGRIRAQVPVGREPEGVTATPDGRLAYVTSEADNKVYIVDPTEANVVATIATGARPRSVVFSGDGARAFVADENDATVTVVDTARRAAIGTITLPPSPTGAARPMGTARSPDGQQIYVTTGRGGSVVALDARTGTPARTFANVGARPWGVAAYANAIYTANGSSNDVSVIDVTSGKVQRVAVGHAPWGVVVKP